MTPPRQRAALLLLAAASPALAGPAIELGGHGGLLTRDEDEPLGAGWYSAPRLGVWLTRGVALETEVGLAGGRDRADTARWRSVIPWLGVVGDPLGADRSLPLRPLLLAQVGVEATRVRPDDADTARTRTGVLLAAGTGVTIPVAGAFTLRSDLRLVADLGPHDAILDDRFLDLLWTAGFETRFDVTRDRDRDFVPDRVDACPLEPEDLDGFEDDDGCKEPDDDGDGVRDELDACDDQPEDLDGVDDHDGCPED